jgi:undecaprenyl-diphosphatase
MRTDIHSLSPRGLVTAGWIALAVALTVFGALAWNVEMHRPLVDLDAAITRWFEDHRAAPVTALMLAVSAVHSLGAIAAWSLVFAVVLAQLRERFWILTLGLAVPGGMALNALLKVIFERGRPRMDDPLVLLDTYSFPSGHTAASTMFYGVLAAFLVSRVREPGRRARIVFGAVAMVLLVALSRVYLGAHYASDVIAATCSSIVWLVICLSGVHGLVRRRMEGR